MLRSDHCCVRTRQGRNIISSLSQAPDVVLVTRELPLPLRSLPGQGHRSDADRGSEAASHWPRRGARRAGASDEAPTAQSFQFGRAFI